MGKKSALILSTWNIQGGCAKKFCDVDFCSFFSNSDLICIQETWADNFVDFDFPGFSLFSSCRSRKKKAKRNSGGVATFFRSSFKKGIHKLDSSSPDTIWCKLDKYFFGLTNDIYLCNVYIPPETFPKSSEIDPFDTLSNDICKFSNLGDIVIVGDLNARTGSITETYFNTDSSDMLTADVMDVKNRNNRDVKVNNYGRCLLELCSSADLTILNGRFAGDLKGDFTCHHYNGSSVVDYCITQRSMLSDIQYVHVSPLSPFSDHCNVSFSLSTKHAPLISEEKCPSKPNPIRFIWDENSSDLFSATLNSSETSSKLNDFCQETFHSAENAVSRFTEILIDASLRSLKIRRRKQVKKTQIKKNKAWFDQCCWSLRQRLKRLSLQLKKEPWAHETRIKYFSTLKEYKKLLKQCKRRYKAEILTKLENMSEKNPKEFWSLLNFLDNEVNGKTQKNTTDPNITSTEWTEHFKGLNNLTKNKNFDTDFEKTITEQIKHLDKNPSNLLDYPFTMEEVLDGVKQLKSGKACGIDSISNDMLKQGSKQLYQSLVTLFNTILSEGSFPSNWNTSILTPIFKSGDKSNVDNYRGIALSSCLSKLFTRLLNTRLQNFVEDNNLLADTQFGFRKKCRTADNVFILKSLIEKYTQKKKGKLFVCFVDMKKAFDSVWRDGLFYKLLHHGIDGNFFNVLKSMYMNVNYAVRMENGLSDSFVSTCGVRQGCNLSPLLFNLFINDLPQCFDRDQCDAATLTSRSINCLSWADDLALISLSKQGLQQCINTLQTYCDNWKLTVNVSKTKVLIFSKGNTKKISKEFFIYDSEIEVTDSYTYLGIPFTSSGKFKTARKFLKTKAMRAIFKLKSLLSSENISIALGKDLFDKFVKPILMYGSELTCFDHTSKTLKLIVSKNIPISSPKNTLSFLLKKLQIDDNIPLSIRKSTCTDATHSYIINFERRPDKDMFLRHASGLDIEKDGFSTDNTRLPLDIPEFDILDTRFQKFLLGVHSKSSNDGVRGELGTFPIIIPARIQLIKYWHRLVNLPEDSLLRDAYNTVLTDNQDWINHVKDILCYHGFGHIWMKPEAYNIDYIVNQLRLRLQDTYIQKWFNSIENNSKLSFLSKSKECYEQETYLYDINNFEIRKAITQLRISSHKLNIETGRYYNVAPDQRFCPFCPKHIEDEFHFLMECSRYAILRNELFTFLESSTADFKRLDATDRFVYIFGCHDSHNARIGKYIKDCFAIRKSNESHV